MADAGALDAIFKAYDVRGLVGSQLDDDTVRAIGAATAEVLADAGALVVGHDMRPSSRPLVDAFIAGVTATGTDVIDIGLASTDMLYFASGEFDAAGAMFTASHNPPAYNGIKLCRAGAQPVSMDTGLADIRDRARDVLSAPLARDGATAGEVRTEDVLPRFAAHVRTFVDLAALRPVTLAVDAGNGMAGHVVPAVFEDLPFEVVELYFELDGTFPNHPANPLEPENLVDLQRVVREQGLPLGLAFDGDADRMFAVDEHGDLVPSSLIAAVVADRLLAAHPGETILYNLICSHAVPETIEAAGGTAVRTRVGHSFIKARMAETGAIFGAEHSGHYYFRDNYRADSGIIAALVLLEAVADAGAPLSEVVAPYDRYVASGELNFEVADVPAATAAVAEAFADRGESDREDGLTVRTAAGWFNLRPSNTEPLLRLNVEGPDRPSMERLRDEVAATVRAAG
ncbi:MAG: phosphomannomutase/phosphoglucomutase [Actinobacteria bacterium]|nr:phosphomannomutase/phosphoglucomutase [Actinomycetota bacterium]